MHNTYRLYMQAAGEVLWPCALAVAHLTSVSQSPVRLCKLRPGLRHGSAPQRTLCTIGRGGGLGREGKHSPLAPCSKFKFKGLPN